MSIKRTSKQPSIVAIVCVCLASLAPSFIQAATIGDIFLISKEPFFAEVPVCDIGQNASDFTVRVETDESLNSEGTKTFTDNMQSIFNARSETEGLISIASDSRLPEGIAFVVSILDKEAEIADSTLFSGLFVLRDLPEDFGCVENVVADEDISFVVDVVEGDTWRNIADMVNVVWYKKKYTLERVMLALYKHNNNESLELVPGIDYPLPDRILIPEEAYPFTIDIDQLPLASYLDEVGRLEVVKSKPDTSDAELQQLRSEFAVLQEQLDILRNQLVDSQELAKLKDSEVSQLRHNLVNTRKRIAVLEKENKVLSDKGIVEIVSENINSYPLEWIVALIVIFIMVTWLAIRATRYNNRRYIDDVRHYREKKNF